MGLLVHHSDAPSAGRDETRGYGRFSLPDPIFLLKPQRNSSCGRAGSRRLDPSPLRQASDLVLYSCLIMVPRSAPPADHYMGRFRNARRPQLEFGCASRQVFGSGREIPEYELRGGGKQRDGRTAAWPGGRTAKRSARARHAARRTALPAAGAGVPPAWARRLWRDRAERLPPQGQRRREKLKVLRRCRPHGCGDRKAADDASRRC